MKSLGLSSVLCAAVLGFAVAAPAHASFVSFEDATPDLYFDGDSVSSGGFDFTIANAPGGFGFGVVDTADSFLFSNAPSGTHGQFLAVLNDGAAIMHYANDNPFYLTGLDFGFIAPLPGLAGGGPVGALLAQGIDLNGNIVSQGWDFSDNGIDTFTMRTLGLADMGALANGVTAVAFYACLYDGANGCVSFAGDNLAQFALDDISVPEPSSLALFSLALAGLLMMGARRRIVR